MREASIAYRFGSRLFFYLLKTASHSFYGFVETGMVEELRTLALYLRELQLREKYGGILD